MPQERKKLKNLILFALKRIKHDYTADINLAGSESFIRSYLFLLTKFRFYATIKAIWG